MLTLGIETSGRDGSVALLREREVVAQRGLSQAGRRHARTLVYELQQLLTESHVSPRDCEIVAVSQGPGSFTGLRVGVVCAKTWAYATGCRLVGVDTLLAIASSVDPCVGRVDVIADAQRDELFLGQYRSGSDDVWAAERDVRIVSADDWLNDLTGDHAVTGPAVEKLRDRIPGNVEVLPVETQHPSAIEVGRLGHRLATAGPTLDHWALKPLYLRKSAAEERAEENADGRSLRG